MHDDDDAPWTPELQRFFDRFAPARIGNFADISRSLERLVSTQSRALDALTKPIDDLFSSSRFASVGSLLGRAWNANSGERARATRLCPKGMPIEAIPPDDEMLDALEKWGATPRTKRLREMLASDRDSDAGRRMLRAYWIARVQADPELYAFVADTRHVQALGKELVGVPCGVRLFVDWAWSSLFEDLLPPHLRVGRGSVSTCAARALERGAQHLESNQPHSARAVEGVRQALVRAVGDMGDGGVGSALQAVDDATIQRWLEIWKSPKTGRPTSKDEAPRTLKSIAADLCALGLAKSPKSLHESLKRERRRLHDVVFPHPPTPPQKVGGP